MNAIKSVILMTIFSLYKICNGEANESLVEAECVQKHNKCLFVLALEDSVGLSLLHVLNQHPQVKLQGSNNGLFVDVRKCNLGSYRKYRWGMEYEDALRSGKYRVAWYDPEQEIDFKRALIALFNIWYGTSAQEDDIIGFLESDYVYSMSEYANFKKEVNALKDLCKESKIILQLSYNLAQVKQQPKWKNKSDDILQRLFYHFQSYYHEYPNDAIIVTEEDIHNSTQYYNIFKFIGLKYQPEKFLLERLEDL